jgi:hypothetical protein
MRDIGTRVLSLVIAAVSISALGSHPCRAWNQSEIQWLTIPTEHFSIQYHAGLERYALQAAATAEAVYGPITDFYGYRPGNKIYININDTEDEAGGATYYYLNRIDITATPLDFAFRGSAAWVANVVTHEFTHMVSVQRSMKFSLRVPAFYLQAINFEKEKRPDVINGYPNLQASVAIPGELLPNWFAEGTAQYQCATARNDIWDSHRDMLLRTAVLSNELLTLDEMGVFGKTSLGSEMVYNQGFSLVRFIASRYGEDTLRRLIEAMSSLKQWSFGGPCKDVLGLSQGALYHLWKQDLEESYGAVAARVREREVTGERVAGDGFMNLFPVSGPRAGRLFYLSNVGRDYSDLDLVSRDSKGRVQRMASGVGSRFSVSPDGTTICFARRTRKNERGYNRYDLFTMTVDGKHEKRLTHGLRAMNPEWSPDGTRIACITNGGGSQRIAVVDAETGEATFLTPPVSGREYLGLSWGAGGMLASRFDGLSRDIVLVDPERGSETVVLGTAADERDPCWGPDGTGFFYASDRTGIFNIYYREMNGGRDIMVTNVIGGAFNPYPSGRGLLFSAFGPEGYEIRSLEDWRARAVAVDGPGSEPELMETRLSVFAPRVEGSAGPEGAVHSERDSLVGGSDVPRRESFGIEYTKLSLYPTVMAYEGKARLGLYLDTGDYLGRQSLFAGGSINADGDFDLNLSFETRQFKPTLGLEVYRNRKHYSYVASDGYDDYDIKIRYDLWDAFFSCRLEFVPMTPTSRTEVELRYNHGEYGLNMELWQLLAQREFKGEGGWNYYLANELSLLFHYRSIREEIDSDINPRSGRTLELEVTRAYDKLHSGDFEWMFRPAYNKDYFGRYLLAYEEFIPLPFWRHALSIRVQGGALDRSDIDDFFYLYLGSRDGLRGYSYFSMGGTKTAMGRVTYRFPVFRNINKQVLALYAGSLYTGVYAEAGKAWTADEFDLTGNKKDVGFDLRLKGFTFYSFPIAASFEAAYGLDDVVYRDPFNAFTTFYEGKRWKFYGSVLFSF